MPERRHREQRSPGDFAPILSGEDPPLIVGGQAVNIWAELYARKLPTLEPFAPFTSADADIYGSRALAETLAQCAGWECRPVQERDSVSVAILSKPSSEGEAPLTIEVLQEVNGLTMADLNLNTVVELAPGERYRIPPPMVLLKAKLYNLVSLANLDRPQDLKHTRMLWQIVPERLNELLAENRAGNITTANLVGAIDYATQVVHAGFAGNAIRAYGFDPRDLIPQGLLHARGNEVRSAVQRYFEGLPTLASYRSTSAEKLSVSTKPSDPRAKRSTGYAP
jgi:hypothetical protein